MTDALVLLSGGTDSTTCLAMALEENDKVRALTLLYGQKHEAEVRAAQAVAGFYGIDHEVVKLPYIFAGGDSVLVAENQLEMPHMTYEEISNAQGVSPTYVPFRNGNLLSAATAMALVRGADRVYFGAHAEDAKNWAYPDCTPEFIGAMANAIYVGTYSKVRLITPIMWMTKAQVIMEGSLRDAPFKLTMSCYEGANPACGECPTCVARWNAFKQAGLADPIDYEVTPA